jgi:hypothetical protein
MMVLCRRARSTATAGDLGRASRGQWFKDARRADHTMSTVILARTKARPHRELCVNGASRPGVRMEAIEELHGNERLQKKMCICTVFSPASTPPQWVKLSRLFSFLRINIFLPVRDFNRARKPNRRFRTRWLGLKVSRGPLRTCVL